MTFVDRLNIMVEKLGLELIGITDGTPLEHLTPVLQERHRNKYFTDFENTEIMCRIDPGLFMPTCKSIISLAMPYLPTGIPPGGSIPSDDNDNLRGLVARFVLGPDYHKIFDSKGSLIIEFIKGEISSGFNYRITADRNPLVEKGFASRCGGLIGENTLYISPRYGTWVILGEILLDITLPAWEQEYNGNHLCLGCGRCREACPTGALEAPFRLNGRRCLSYLTQAKDEIPVEFREALGTRIYGCDTCLEVCPLNKDALPSGIPEYASAIVNPRPYLKEAANITNKQFRSTVGQTAAGWRGPKTWRRNAVIGMKNSSI